MNFIECLHQTFQISTLGNQWTITKQKVWHNRWCYLNKLEISVEICFNVDKPQTGILKCQVKRKWKTTPLKAKCKRTCIYRLVWEKNLKGVMTFLEWQNQGD